jgi:hypothetical protein
MLNFFPKLPPYLRCTTPPLCAEEPKYFFESTSFSHSALPKNLYVESGKLVVGDWKNFLLRFFVPSIASAQDAKVSDYFISYFSEFLFQKEIPQDAQKVKSMLSLAEQHVVRGRNWVWGQTLDTCQLERYTLAARQRLGYFEPERTQQSLRDKCRFDHRTLFDKWTKLGFDEEAFWGAPDLVNFVFRSHLNRHLAHPYYKHTIRMLPTPVRRGEQLVMERQPHLLMNGHQTSWLDIQKRVKIDENDKLYSLENGQKKYWTYLEKGLTQWDVNRFDHPCPLRQLDAPPLRSRVEVVTTHAHKEDWNLADRLLKGSRHSFFRIVPGAGFSTRHPEAGLEEGAVYSLGWGAKWRDFSIFKPLSTLRGRWFCPDAFEFLKEDQWITPIDITDDQVLHLFEIVKRRNQEEHPFHIITSNCCGVTADILKEAGIMSFCTKDHMATMWYKFFMPKWMRRHIDRGWAWAERTTPVFVVSRLHTFSALVYSALLMPLFSLLGAWRTTLSFEDEDGSSHDVSLMRARASNRVKALFSNIFDVFSPRKMEFDLTKNIYRQQKRMEQTYFERHE